MASSVTGQQGGQAGLPAELPASGFNGLRLASPAQTGPITFTSSRANAWSDGATDRLYLRGDVRVQLGVYSFKASRAVVWMERLEDSKTIPGNALYQVAVYFDRAMDQNAVPGVSQGGDRLMVTALIEGDPALRTDALKAEAPKSNDAFVLEGDQRLDRLVRSVSGEPEGGENRPIFVPGSGSVGSSRGSPIVPGMSQPYEPDSVLQKQLLAAGSPEVDQTRLDELGPATRLEPIFVRDGLLTAAAGEISFVPPANPADENTVIITGGAVVQYTDARRNRTLQLTADRAVAFLAPGKLTDFRQFSADTVRGIYLEGNVVATDGNTTLRGPRIYYDLIANKAVVVDAVFHTYDARRGLPLYMRAKTLKQTARNQIEAQNVTLANSSFFEPHLSLGATTITVTQEKQTGGEPDRFFVQGKGLTLKAGATPFFYYPSFAGDLERFPLKEVRFENSSNSGFEIKTRWDLFGLLGFDPPSGVRADLLVDGYVDRGLGLGVEGGYNLKSIRGSFLGYILPQDNGTDQLSSGAKRDANGETRGILLFDHRWFIDDKWSVLLEGSYISDENFVNAFYEPLGQTRREFTNAAELRRIDGNTALAILGKGNLNNFTANEYLLQSQGYTVDKLPEVSYARVQDDLLAALAPGFLTYSSEFRFSNMAFSFTDKTPRQLGFGTNRLAQDAFGLDAGQNIGETLRAAGYPSDQVLRFDTRHELNAAVKVGPVNVNPFVVGRITAYDKDFDQFSGRNEEKYRLWSSAGVRAATTIQKVDDSVESDLFDLHRIRHIIEPNVTAWTSGTSIDQNGLPVFDESIESLADGSAVKLGINQVFQTQRGGEGRTRSVDWLKINTEITYSTGSTPRESPIMRFFDSRPEYSQLGNFANVDMAWQVADAMALTFNSIYDIDLSQPSRTTTGVLFQHSPDFTTFIESHFINARDATYVSAGADYRLTDKYTLGVVAVYDVDRSEFQELSARLNRELPNLLVSLKIRYNNITDEVGIGFALQPLARDIRKQRLQRLGRDRLDFGEVVPPDPTAPASTERSEPSFP